MPAVTRNSILFILLCILTLLAFVAQLLLGSVKIPFTDVALVLLGNKITNNTFTNIILQSRLPGALAALCAGAGLAVSGLQMQTMFRNPVAGPYVLGISWGASLGVALFIMASSAFGLAPQNHIISGGGIIVAALLGSIAIFFINFLLSYRLNDMVSILIIGLMIGGGISALIEIMQSFSSKEALKNFVLWSMGSFRYVDNSQIPYLIIIAVTGCVFSFLLSKPLNLLLLGDTYAASSGLNIRSAKIMIVLCTSLLAGGITAFCGPIGFIGLAVPHLARSLFKTADHKILTPGCILLGAFICCLCNVLVTAPGANYILPVNAITSLLGAPAVIWIILKRKKV